MKLFSKSGIKHIGQLLWTTAINFVNDNGLKYSASLAYYTVFSLAPLMMLMIFIVGIYYGHDAFTGQIYPQLRGFVGDDAAAQVQEMVKSIQMGKSTMAIVIGAVTVIIGATGVFLDMQDTLNIIWRIKAKPKRSWVKFLTNRLLSFSLVISIGFLMLVSLLINTLVDALSDKLAHYLHSDVTVLLFSLINLAITFVVIMVLFAIIFKFLPDAEIQWKHVRVGAFFTALLFMLGKYLIGLYISSSKIGSTYGAAGSIIIIFAWIYYASALVYMGAEFTQVYTEFRGSRIEPSEYAVAVKQTEGEKDVATLPVQNPEIKKVATEG
ncbi:ribonuclease BN [Mucilaginibacter sp. PPCGB 2223]|uniref:YihY/virulence factor BrkB family protein n=1 Tax=Mucilaginibacter sp. PPCGB 2223 TaxID=1886027 RepID=UPI000825D8FA|nr:YihY/virulence factor BrkB family protein [Mucilaginibacter sp. PPCGB 2223]OCX50682.1 ribonuclease BN [Mucilaginibacter sp. PPCGB 2223]